MKTKFNGKDSEEAQELLNSWKEFKKKSTSSKFVTHQESRHTNDKEIINRWLVQYLISLYPVSLSIFLDTGTTVEQTARYLLQAIALGKLSAVSVVTNSEIVFYNLSEHTSDFDITLIHTGGEYNRYHQAFWGEQTIEAMIGYDYHAIVIGTSGISFKENNGIYVHGATGEQTTKGAFMKKETDYRIILADYSKIGTRDVVTCTKPDELLKNVRRQCLIVTTPPPNNDVLSQSLFEEEYIEFEGLCERLNKQNSENQLIFSASFKELKLIVVDPESGEEIEELSRSSRDFPISKNKGDNSDTSSDGEIIPLESAFDTRSDECKSANEE